MKRRSPGLLWTVIFSLAAHSALATALDTRYTVTGVNGSEAPPQYILRLDGFFGGDEVTFGADSVFLDVFTDGSAHLFGTVSVVEVDDMPPGGLASTWDLDVIFDPGTGPNPAFQYFHLNDTAVDKELVNQADASDFARLSENPPDGTKPFQLGIGAIPDSKCISPAPCLSATGWLRWQHFNGQNIVSEWNDDTADFLMEVQPIPEPSTAVLFAAGIVGLAHSGRRRLRDRDR